MKRKVASGVSLGLSLVLMSTVLTGCRFGFASDPDDPNEEPELDYIDDDEEYENVAEAFDEYLDDCEFDELTQE